MLSNEIEIVHIKLLTIPSHFCKRRACLSTNWPFKSSYMNRAMLQRLTTCRILGSISRTLGWLEIENYQ